jgi:beta-glucosidase
VTVVADILNNQETARQSVDVQIDERTLFEMYLPAFEGAIAAGVGSIMCSCACELTHAVNFSTMLTAQWIILLWCPDNKIGGRWSCEHNATLNTDLRDRLKFDGWVMSDCKPPLLPCTAFQHVSLTRAHCWFD